MKTIHFWRIIEDKINNDKSNDHNCNYVRLRNFWKLGMNIVQCTWYNVHYSHVECRRAGIKELMEKITRAHSREYLENDDATSRLGL